MPKMVVYELFEMAAKTPEEAIEKAKDGSGRRSKSMYVAADYLDHLAHPVHLLEAQERFATSATNEPVDESSTGGVDPDYAESAE